VNQELTLRLVKRFPVLYQDYRSPMTQTAMCWGFDHGDGWFEIIWQLSLAIEEELAYSWTKKRWLLFKKSIFCSWNAFVYKLSPEPRTGMPHLLARPCCSPSIHPRKHRARRQAFQ
jgi:hypothetical protein